GERLAFLGDDAGVGVRRSCGPCGLHRLLGDVDQRASLLSHRESTVRVEAYRTRPTRRHAGIMPVLASGPSSRGGAIAAMGTLDGKVAVITGAGRGIGRGEALLFGREGARVVVNDVGAAWDGTGADDRPAAQVAGEIRAAGGQAVAHHEDIAEEDGAASVVRLALESWGRLDVVVNNAGILRDRRVFNMAAAEWDAVIR